MPYDGDSCIEQNNFKVRRIRVYMKSESPLQENLQMLPESQKVQQNVVGQDVKKKGLVSIMK